MDTFYNYGVTATREIISVACNSAGEYDWTPHVTQCQYLADNPAAPWNREDAVSKNPADYPGILWTPPLIVEIIKSPQPVYDDTTQTADPVLVWTDTGCTRDWVVRDLTTEERAAVARKVWQNTQAFLAEFTIAEMAGIGLSSDPTIAALRVLLSVWSGQIYSDDERVETGLAALHIAGIITSARRTEIVAINNP